MNVPLLFRRRNTGWMGLALMLATGGLIPLSRAADSGDISTREASAAAQAWLTEIDAGKYEQSYDEGCTAFHNKVTQSQWITVLKALRPGLGGLVNRTETKATYRPEGIEGLDGECMVITYNTSFSKMNSETEIVVLKREDGKWRGAGYNAQPQQPAAADQEPPDATTTSSTTTSPTAH